MNCQMSFSCLEVDTFFLFLFFSYLKTLIIFLWKAQSTQILISNFLIGNYDVGVLFEGYIFPTRIH